MDISSPIPFCMKLLCCRFSSSRLLKVIAFSFQEVALVVHQYVVAGYDTIGHHLMLLGQQKGTLGSILSVLTGRKEEKESKKMQ